MKAFLTGVGVIALCAAAGGAVVLSSPSAPEARDAPAVQSTQISATALCGGAFERTLEEGINVEDVDEGVSVSSWAFADASGATIESGDESTELEGSPGFASGSEPLVGVLTAPDSDEIHMAGANVHVAQAGDTRGMAASACVSRTSDTWLVGSTSDVGTSNQLVITNPAQTAVTVELSAYGSAGELDLGSNATIAVDAASTERVDLDGVIPGDSRIGLHATTDAGTVGISLQQNSLDGATPAGVSYVTGSVPGTNLTIPGVAVADDSASSLRLVNPGEEAATASISLIGEDGSDDLPGGSNVTVAAGSVLDLSLDGVDGGDYAVSVESDQPVAAGIQLTSTEEKSGARDIAWAAPSEAMTSSTVMFGDVPAKFGVVGEKTVKVTIRPIEKDGTLGEPETVTAKAGAYATFDVPDGAVGLTVESAEPVIGAVTATPKLAEGRAIDWVPLTGFESARNSQRIALSN